MKRSMALFVPTLVVGLCCAILPAWSQLPGGIQIPGGGSIPGGGAIPGMGNLQSLTQILHLSPAQLSKLQPILQNELGKIAGIRKNPRLSGQQKVKQVQSVQAQTDPQVKSILDPSQFKQWQGLRQSGLSELTNSFLH